MTLEYQIKKKKKKFEVRLNMDDLPCLVFETVRTLIKEHQKC